LPHSHPGIVPVELKKSKRPPTRGGVYPNHMIQNLAYCARRRLAPLPAQEAAPDPR
jgi:hypothetical protein